MVDFRRPMPRSARPSQSCYQAPGRRSIEHSISRRGCSPCFRPQGVGIRLGGDLIPGKVFTPLRPSSTQPYGSPRLSAVNSAKGPWGDSVGNHALGRSLRSPTTTGKGLT